MSTIRESAWFAAYTDRIGDTESVLFREPIQGEFYSAVHRRRRLDWEIEFVWIDGVDLTGRKIKATGFNATGAIGIEIDGKEVKDILSWKKEEDGSKIWKAAIDAYGNRFKS